MVGNKAQNSPMLQVVSDLMAMRAPTPPLLSREDLDKQKSTFANEPALFDYLQAAYALYVEHQPDNALKHLPDSVPSSLD